MTAFAIDTRLDRNVVRQPRVGDTDALTVTAPTGNRYQLRITPA